jgi:HD-like signal output (HDOD) protein
MSYSLINLSDVIEQANGLAPLPATAVRLAELIGDPDCHVEQVAELIAFDQPLTLKLLRAANSVASASATPVGNVAEAVIRMGTAQVLALALAAGARPFLQPGIPAYGLAEGALWRHSVAAAVATEVMRGCGGLDPPPEAFTAALLHDVGKLVMNRVLTPNVLGFILRAQEVDHQDRVDAELLLLEVQHAELGGLIAQHWRLPPRVVNGITYHHHPEMGFDPICDFTYLANQVAKVVEAGVDGRTLALSVAPDVAERLGEAPGDLARLCPLALARYAQVSRRYNAV